MSAASVVAADINFFTTESLRNLYRAAGFKTVQLDYVGRSLTVDRLFYNIGVISKSEGVKKALRKVSNKMHLNKLNLYLNLNGTCSGSAFRN